MTTNRSKYVVHLESATRAPGVPQLATGESQDHGDEQGRVQSATGVGFDLQDRSGGTDLASTSRLGQSMNFRYFIYILIDRKRGGVEAVWGYCCSCSNGLRTVGCCSHIATVLWFLGLGQCLPEILIPASFLDDCMESVGQE